MIKTSRLMVKRFSTVKDTQRVSQSYMEKRRRRREIEVTRRRGGVKKRKIDLASIQFPKCVLHSPEHPKRFTMLGRKEKGNEEIEVTRRRGGGVDQEKSDRSSQ